MSHVSIDQLQRLKRGNPPSTEGHYGHHNSAEEVAQNKISPKPNNSLNDSEANMYKINRSKTKLGTEDIRSSYGDRYNVFEC